MEASLIIIVRFTSWIIINIYLELSLSVLISFVEQRKADSHDVMVHNHGPECKTMEHSV